MEADARSKPIAIRLDGKRFKVKFIEDVWEVDVEWWRERRTHRRYFRARLPDGRTITLFHDLVGDGWYQQRE